LNGRWRKPVWTDRPRPFVVAATVAAGLLLATTSPRAAENQLGIGPLRTLHPNEIPAHLAADTWLLIDAASIERFLRALEGNPPDWAAVYGHGHHDPNQDERLFRLNRERDELRAGHPLLRRRIAFLWSGELSAYDAEAGGFRVALGPVFTATGWGMVRFKYEDLPANLIAVPAMAEREVLRRRIEQGGTVDIDVVMAGVLIQDESIIYDFSHDEEGRGLIMPVVRIDHMLYVRRPQ
jgi:hypothetical protein